MTIPEDMFMSIREENPELDAELRSILIARAQTGATIAEIKDDYRKNTGLRFPVYENVTEFLLGIPGIMAYCSERGTRIFNVIPTEKNKHIYDMVMKQKPTSYYSDALGYSKNPQYAQRRESGYQSVHSNVAHGPVSWRSNNDFRSSDIETQSENNVDFQVQPVQSNTQLQSEHRHQQQQQPQQQQQLQQEFHHHHHHHQQQEHPPPLNLMVNNNVRRNESSAHWDRRNDYYQDNCQYLFNRIYSYEQSQKSTTTENLNTNNTPIITSNNNSNNTNINNNLNIETRQIFNQPPVQPVREEPFKRPIGRAVRAIHTSSPSGTRCTSRSTESIFSSDMEGEAHLLDFPLLGDDFFLYLARMELKCKFKKYQRVLQSGLCVSGQNIKAATRRISRFNQNSYSNRRVIVNVGSVDIMQGKPLVQIEHDYRNLIDVMHKRGFMPILTTLAPLANYSHDSSLKSKLERFNEFIKRQGQCLLVIDVWARFVSERKQTLFDCYQNEPRQVTGASESYVFWNKIGRQRVLQLIESALEY